MLVAFTLIFLGILSAVGMLCFVCGVAIGRKGREHLRSELANLRERLAASEGRYTEARRITGELLEVVKEKVGLKPHGKFDIQTIRGTPTEESPFDFSTVASNYVPPEVKNCPECSISVRAETWPQECPGCHCVFGFE